MIGKADSHLELSACSPRLDKLKRLLKESPYNPGQDSRGAKVHVSYSHPTTVHISTALGSGTSE